MWDRGLRVQNVSLINFHSNETPAIIGPTILGRCTNYCGGMYQLYNRIYNLDVVFACNHRLAN